MDLATETFTGFHPFPEDDAGLEPYDQPESLSPKAYVDIVASMLQRNNYPAGKEELHADAEALKNLMLR